MPAIIGLGNSVSFVRNALDDIAGEYLASLAPSDQRQSIAWIAAAKKLRSRQRRASEAIELLTRGEKLGMR